MVRTCIRGEKRSGCAIIEKKISQGKSQHFTTKQSFSGFFGNLTLTEHNCPQIWEDRKQIWARNEDLFAGDNLIVEDLARARADLDIQEELGATPVYLATYFNHVHTVKQLLAFGNNFSSDSDSDKQKRASGG